MASITTFSRLEPQPRRGDVTVGAAAPVRDPLWLLARQWQVGEFAGQDGGTSDRRPVARRRRRPDALRRRADPAGHHARRAPIRPDGGAAGVDHRARHRAAAARRRHVRRDPPRASTPAGTSSPCWPSRSRPATTAPTSSPGTRSRCRATSSSPRSTRRPPPSPACTPVAASTVDGCGASSPVATCRGSTAPSNPATSPRCARRPPRGWRGWRRCSTTPTPTPCAGSRPASSTPRRWPDGARPTRSARPRSPRPATTATRSTGTSSTSTAR